MGFRMAPLLKDRPGLYMVKGPDRHLKPGVWASHSGCAWLIGPGIMPWPMAMSTFYLQAKYPWGMLVGPGDSRGQGARGACNSKLLGSNLLFTFLDTQFKAIIDCGTLTDLRQRWVRILNCSYPQEIYEAPQLGHYLKILTSQNKCYYGLCKLPSSRISAYH